MKRSKQKTGMSPQLRPSSRNRSGSVTSSPLQTPELSPATYSLDTTAVLSQSAPTLLPSSMLGKSILSESRQANFRSSSPRGGILLGPAAARTAGGPQTGLSLLMNGGVVRSTAPTAVSSTNTLTSTANTMGVIACGTMTADQQQRYQQDLLERDIQASSLAAAGMLADSVSLTTPPGLQAPPTLATTAGPTPSTCNEIDSINWNLMDIGTMQIDDIDMDFANLFDPASELANMQTQGSGWPSAETLDSTQPHQQAKSDSEAPQS